MLNNYIRQTSAGQSKPQSQHVSATNSRQGSKVNVTKKTSEVYSQLNVAATAKTKTTSANNVQVTKKVKK